MPVTRPISDLRNRTKELSRLCHDSGEPIFITRNGEGDMVLMSLAAYERLQARLELYRMLDEAEVDVAAGDRGVSVAAVRGQLKRSRHAGRGGGRSRRARASQGAGA
jgi:prevent-host-death family protein